MPLPRMRAGGDEAWHPEKTTHAITPEAGRGGRGMASGGTTHAIDPGGEPGTTTHAFFQVRT